MRAGEIISRVSLLFPGMASRKLSRLIKKTEKTWTAEKKCFGSENVVDVNDEGSG
jgi:hypothetical protein